MDVIVRIPEMKLVVVHDLGDRHLDRGGESGVSLHGDADGENSKGSPVTYVVLLRQRKKAVARLPRPVHHSAQESPSQEPASRTVNGYGGWMGSDACAGSPGAVSVLWGWCSRAPWTMLLSTPL